MVKTIVLFLLLATSAPILAQVPSNSKSSVSSQTWIKKSYSEGQYQVEIPSNWREMNDTERAAFSTQVRKPIVALIYPEKSATFLVTINETPFSDGGIKMVMDMQKANILNLYSNKVRIEAEEVVTINKKEYGILELTGTADIGKGTVKKYHYLSYTLVGNQVAISSFICDWTDKRFLADIAKYMANSQIWKAPQKPKK